MSKLALIWTMIVAVPVGVAAIATGYIYRETGQLPFQQADNAVPAATEQTDTGKADEIAKAPEATPEAAKEDEASSTTEVADIDARIKPSFDVVGVEPTGETVVAGRSDAGAIVALVANGVVVGKSIANQDGEWTIILDEPLKPGDYDVGLQIHDQNGSTLIDSDQRLAVSVAENGQERPLVVLNTADGPSDVLQKPEAEAPETAVADAPKDDPAETTVAAAPAAETPTASDEPAVNAPAETAVAIETLAVAETQVPVANEVAETPAAAASTETKVSEAPAKPEKPAEIAAVAADPVSSNADEVKSAPEVTADTPAPAKAAPERNTETAVATAAPVTTPTNETSATSGSTSTVTVEAVESEKDKVFVAGTGEPGSSVRVYVGEEFQGEAKVDSSGKWLVQGSKNVPEGNVDVRADLIAEDGNKVDARAAVTFEKEQDKQIVLTKVVATGTGGGAEGQGAEVKKSLPVVIIRKGDNLWRISRRLYGDGVRYTTIYQANQDQIRNPDLIYPGQVFLTPEGDLNWPSPDGENGTNG
ncbi:MAG: LysM peptidoglycan-binding domain-containing protein [Roseibium sp.]